MDYLRRLHPAHADHGSAARLDAPLALAATVALSPTTFEVPAPSPTEAARATVPDAAPLRASQRPLTEISPRAAPPVEIATSLATSLAAPHRSPVATPSQPMRLTRSALPPSMVPARATPPSIDATAQPAQPAEAPPLTRAEPRSSPAARRPEPSAVAVALQPLRAEAVRERDRGAADEPAPIIHVTIDRIDVRLPSTAATPPAPGRRRAAPTVGALGDYLRGRATEGST